MDGLAADEKQVLRLRFAEAKRSRTREEVAALLAVSVDTVRQIELRALRKLRLSALGALGGGFNGWDEV